MAGPSPAVLRSAAGNCDAVVVSLLLQTAVTGAYDLVREADEHGCSALHHVAKAPPTEEAAQTITLLLDARADANGRTNPSYETPLSLATRVALRGESNASRLTSVETLLERKADANMPDERSGLTLLMEAASCGRVNVCSLLLEHSADPRCQNADGLTALDLASSKGHTQVKEVLTAARAVEGSVIESFRDAKDTAAPQVEVPQRPTSANGAANTMRPGTVAPKSASPLSPIARLLAECAKSGLSVEWCTDEEQLSSMMRLAKKWNRVSFPDLKRECSARRIPIEGVAPADKRELAARLRRVLEWEHMSDEQLRETCCSRGVPFPADSGLSNFASVREADRFDLLARLMQASYGLRPGDPGPLPLGPQVGRNPSNMSGVSAKPHGVPMPKVPRGVASPAWTPPRDDVPSRATPSNDSNAEEYERAEPRLRKLLEQFPTFCGDLPPRDEYPSWTDGELKQYVFSNGYIKPRPSKPAAPSGPTTEHYRALGLTLGAEVEAVRKAYRRLALEHHPDKNPTQQDATAFQRITAAYEAICHQAPAA